MSSSARAASACTLRHCARTALRIIRATAARELYGITALTVTGGLLPVAAALAIRTLLNDLVRSPRHIGAVTVAGCVLVLAAAGIGGNALQGLELYLKGRMNRKVRLAMRSRLFMTINGWIGIERFEDPDSLNRIRLAEQAGDSAPQALVTAGVQLGQAGVTMVGFLITILLILPVLLVTVFAAAIPIGLLQLRLGRLRANTLLDTSAYYRRLMFYDMLATDIRAAKEIRLFGLRKFVTDRMLRDLRSAGALERAMDRSSVRIETLIGAVGALVDIVSISVIVYLAVHGELSVGDVTVLFAALVALNFAIGSATDQAASAYQAALMFRYFVELTDEEHATSEPVDPMEHGDEDAALGVEFDNVWFRYSKDLPFALSGVSFHMRPGQTVGLVGLNGAGKSTIVKLLCRMYAPERGVIRWNGIDIQIIGAERLRERVSAVFQDFMAYDYSAADNIAVGNLTFLNDRDRIRSAAATAMVDNIIARLPCGYDTLLSRIFDTDEAGNQNSQLSGGQWQRGALARAFLRNDADLVILDEPNSGLDPEAEYDVSCRLHRFLSGKLGLLISHRLNLIRESDMILVLKSGKIVESGTHDELMGAGGYYCELFSLQAVGFERGGIPFRRVDT
ncbi:MAG: ABC transporter ATP-binding protein [Jatrophihabitantaceae bacterium]